MTDLAMNDIEFEFRKFPIRSSIVGGDMEHLDQHGMNTVWSVFGRNDLRSVCSREHSIAIGANRVGGRQYCFSETAAVARHA